MSEPLCTELGAGTHYICACGKSANFPFCDGAHQGSDSSPYKLELAESKTVYLCTCANSGNLPFCDGSHSK